MRETLVQDRLQAQIRQVPTALIGTQIRKARKEYGSHDALVAAMGEGSRQHLIRLEQGKHRPSARLLRLIAETTGKPVDFFLNDAPFRAAA